MRFHPSHTTISPLTLIRRERWLPAPGEILVREGERVDPVQVIGRAVLPGNVHIVNIARCLSVSPRAARRYVKVKPEQRVKQGDVLAAKGRLARRVCRSPVEGIITGIGGGRILIKAPPQEVEIRADYHGTVVRVIPGRGVVLQISGALVQAAWGNGRLEIGVLRRMTEGRDKVLKGRAIDPSCRGTIFVGGSYMDEETLERAVELQARGIIVGSVPPELLERAMQALCPVVATEGIGTAPMSAPIFQLLSTHDGREAILDGRFQTRRGALRPEIIIPLPAEPGTDRLQPRDAPLQVGDRVRAVRSPHTGLTGRVIEIPETKERFPIGAHLPAIRVQPEGEEEEAVWIPVSNLEILR